MDIVQAQADRALADIGKAMTESQQYLTEEAEKIFRRYQRRFAMTREEALAELANPISRAEYDRLLGRIASMPDGDEKRLIEARVNSGAYAYRISRLEALRENIAVETAKTYQAIEDRLTGQLRFTATEAYARRIFAIQQQTAFNAPDLGGVKVAINTPWSGQSYSEILWGDRDRLAESLQQTIMEGYLTGKSWSKTAGEIQSAFGVSYRQAERLVRTETAYISNQADLEAYKDAGIEWYVYIAALDDLTCEVCGPLDGEVFEVALARPGENYPVMHPNCRCTTGAEFGKEGSKGGIRFARDSEGRGEPVPGDMSYEEWRKSKDSITNALNFVEPSDPLNVRISQPQTIARINTEMLAGKWGPVREKVVLTDDRIKHILLYHAEDYALLSKHIPAAIHSPTFILEDSKNANTAMFIKQVEDTNMNVIVKLALKDDEPSLESSIITMHRLGATTLKRLVKKNPIVYTAP